MGCSGGKMLDKAKIEDILNNRYKVTEMTSNGNKVGRAKVSVTDNEIVIHHGKKQDPIRVAIRDLHSHGANGNIIVIRTGSRDQEYDKKNGMTFIWKSSRAEDLYDSVRQCVQSDFRSNRHRFTSSAVQTKANDHEDITQSDNSDPQEQSDLNVFTYRQYDEMISPADLCEVECLNYAELVWNEKTTTGLFIPDSAIAVTDNKCSEMREIICSGTSTFSQCQYSDIDRAKTLGLARTIAQRSNE
jgi:hypothetical protein